MPEHTIAENLTRLQNAKTAIGAAITAKGGTVAAGDGLEEFAADIATITNQYTAGDEGKVVSNSALVAQTAHATITTNGTYDTTTNNSVTVDVASETNWLKTPTLGRCIPTCSKFKNVRAWTAKSWSGLTNFIGRHVWTDGENIYYSNGSSQYVLDKTTFTWSTKTWSGLSNPYGNYVWTDGESIYYSGSSSYYILNKSTSTWSTKTWSGLSSFSGEDVWTDGANVYHSFNTEQYVLDKTIIYDNTMSTTPTCGMITSA